MGEMSLSVISDTEHAVKTDTINMTLSMEIILFILINSD